MLKETPIKTRDGLDIKVGNKFYIVNSKGVSRYMQRHEKRDEQIPSFSGEQRHSIDTCEVIEVKPEANIRKFTVRTPHGCEISYTVKDSCLPKETFGKLENAKAYVQKEIKEDLEKMERKHSKKKTEADEMKKAITQLKKKVKK